ncbi:unnamed protein product [Laminaria digitata]
MLCSRTPATLNSCIADGMTPLFIACHVGHESMVSKLLSPGAMQPSVESDVCPLATAALKGFVGVVRVLFTEEGIRAVRGKMVALPRALYVSLRSCQAKTLRLLLTVDGEEKRSEWASAFHKDRHLLHHGAGLCYSAAVSILLEAGADETARDLGGRVPLDVIGMHLGRDGLPPMDPEKGVAIRRMLQRGPGYRARSWAGPLIQKKWMPVVAVMTALLLLLPPLLLLLCSCLHQPRRPPPLLVCEFSGRRRRTVAMYS